MGWLDAPEYWLGRLILERGIAAVYVLAFVAAARQFRALIGEHGLLPVPRFLARRSFKQSPSIFYVHYSDRFFATVAWSGAALSSAMACGLADVVPLGVTVLLWLLLWVLYLSIVNVGQAWYSFGWESLLLEVGFLAIFLGNDHVAPPVLAMWLARLLLFRVEFGAGLIKLRGDSCWRDLTCLYYHHETQPMPGPLSWFFHHLPRPLHRIEAAGNHFAQLVVPFGLFAPQPVAGVAGAIIVATQLWLVLSGNFAWLNWLTILLACSAIDAQSLLHLPRPELTAAPRWFAALVIVFAVLTLLLSYWPVRNMVSRRQRMNMSFNPFHLVNTYGAFGSVGRLRREVVIEGTDDTRITDQTVWKEYEFKGKPGSGASTAAAMGAVSPAAGLADVVRRHLPAVRPIMVSPIHAAPLAQRPADAAPAPQQSVPGHPAALRAGPALPVPVHHRGRTSARSRLVASVAGSRLPAAHLADRRNGVTAPRLRVL